MIKRNPNENFTHDLQVGIAKENELSKILGDETKIEVKYDRFPNDRHFIEYMRKRIDGNNELSGISVTNAEYYALAKDHYYIIVSVAHLKKVMKLSLKKATLGGDGGRTYGLLLTESEILENI